MSERKPSARPDRDEPGTRERPAPPLGDAARDAAIRTLARQARIYPELDPFAMEQVDARAADGRSSMGPLDVALAHAIHDQAVRRWLTLRFLLQACLTQPFDELEGRVKGALLAGAAQLVLLDRVPAHAAINQAVEWCKVVIRPGAGALVNAVLRKIARLAHEEVPRASDLPVHALVAGAAEMPRDRLPLADGTWRVLAATFLPEDPIERMSIATSVPAGVIARWQGRLGAREARGLAMHALVDAPTVLNMSHAGRPAANTTPHDDGGREVFEGPRFELAALLRERTDLWVQDTASAGAVESIADLRPTMIVDVCAGRGTKTRQLAAMFPHAKIAATDSDDRRLEALRSVFAGHPRVTVAGLRATMRGHVGKADLVLLDVPCSNTGVLARRSEARYRADAAHLASLVDLQRQIIADSIPLLAPGGRVLYSTCSLEPEENQQQAAWAAKWHRFDIRRERQVMPRGLPGDPARVYSDGAYSVLLESAGR